MSLKSFIKPGIVVPVSLLLIGFAPMQTVLAQTACTKTSYTEEFTAATLPVDFTNVTGNISISSGTLKHTHSKSFNNFNGQYNSYALTNYNKEVSGSTMVLETTIKLVGGGGSSSNPALDYGLILKATQADSSGKFKTYRFRVTYKPGSSIRTVTLEEITDKVTVIKTATISNFVNYLKFEKVDNDIHAIYGIPGNVDALKFLDVVSNDSGTYQLGVFSNLQSSNTFGSGEVSFESVGVYSCKADLVADADDGTVYRFFNYRTGAHLYTTSIAERDTVRNFLDQWLYEGEKYSVELTNVTETIPVHRFWQSAIGSHLYVTNETEKNNIMNNLPVYKYEGVKFYVYETQVTDSKPVYRFFNKENGAHLYTDSEAEKNTITSALPKFSFEGIKFYVLN
jgi:hypothetical protein